MGTSHWEDSLKRCEDSERIRAFAKVVADAVKLDTREFRNALTQLAQAESLTSLRRAVLSLTQEAFDYAATMRFFGDTSVPTREGFDSSWGEWWLGKPSTRVLAVSYSVRREGATIGTGSLVDVIRYALTYTASDLQIMANRTGGLSFLIMRILANGHKHYTPEIFSKEVEEIQASFPQLKDLLEYE